MQRLSLVPVGSIKRIFQYIELIADIEFNLKSNISI